MHITHGGWEGSHTCTLGFHKGAVARQVIYRYQLLHSTRIVCFFLGIHNFCFQVKADYHH